MPKIITDPEIKLCKKTMDVYLREYFEEEKRKYKFEKPVGPPNLVNRGQVAEQIVNQSQQLKNNYENDQRTKPKSCGKMYTNELWSKRYRKYILTTTGLNKTRKILVKKDSESSNMRQRIVDTLFKKNNKQTEKDKYSLENAQKMIKSNIFHNQSAADSDFFDKYQSQKQRYFNLKRQKILAKQLKRKNKSMLIQQQQNLKKVIYSSQNEMNKNLQDKIYCQFSNAKPFKLNSTIGVPPNEQFSTHRSSAAKTSSNKASQPTINSQRSLLGIGLNKTLKYQNPYKQQSYRPPSNQSKSSISSIMNVNLMNSSFSKRTSNKIVKKIQSNSHLRNIQRRSKQVLLRQNMYIPKLSQPSRLTIHTNIQNKGMKKLRIKARKRRFENNICSRNLYKQIHQNCKNLQNSNQTLKPSMQKSKFSKFFKLGGEIGYDDDDPLDEEFINPSNKKIYRSTCLNLFKIKINQENNQIY